MQWCRNAVMQKCSDADMRSVDQSMKICRRFAEDADMQWCSFVVWLFKTLYVVHVSHVLERFQVLLYKTCQTCRYLRAGPSPRHQAVLWMSQNLECRLNHWALSCISALLCVREMYIAVHCCTVITASTEWIHSDSNGNRLLVCIERLHCWGELLHLCIESIDLNLASLALSDADRFRSYLK